jgi:hypothetical protein
MAEFFIVNLEAKDFDFEGIAFKRLKGYEEGIKKRGYFEHTLSFHAVADDDLIVEPIIHTGDDTRDNLLTVIDDLCLLLSLSQSRHIACPEYELRGRKTYRSYVLGKSSGSKIVHEHQIGNFLNTAVNTLRQPDWKSITGFIPALYFIIERNPNEIVEFEFISSWITLEILANAYVEQNYSLKKSRSMSISQKIVELRGKYGLDFITDTLLQEYKEVRNHLMHTGTYGKIEQHRVGELSIRLKTSAQLTLLSLLGCKDYVWDMVGLKIWITGSR